MSDNLSPNDILQADNNLSPENNDFIIENITTKTNEIKSKNQKKFKRLKKIKKEKKEKNEKNKIISNKQIKEINKKEKVEKGIQTEKIISDDESKSDESYLNYFLKLKTKRNNN